MEYIVVSKEGLSVLTPMAREVNGYRILGEDFNKIVICANRGCVVYLVRTFFKVLFYGVKFYSLLKLLDFFKLVA